jgi:hypothetical protein
MRINKSDAVMTLWVAGLTKREATKQVDLVPEVVWALPPCHPDGTRFLLRKDTGEVVN